MTAKKYPYRINHIGNYPEENVYRVQVISLQLVRQAANYANYLQKMLMTMFPLSDARVTYHKENRVLSLTTEDNKLYSRVRPASETEAAYFTIYMVLNTRTNVVSTNFGFVPVLEVRKESDRVAIEERAARYIMRELNHFSTN